MRKDAAQTLDFDNLARVEKTLEDSRREIKTLEVHFAALVKTAGAPSRTVPVGF